MAILNGILSKLNGSAGSLTFKQVNRKILVSTQMLVNNNADMIADYSGDQAYKRSVRTYGGEKSAFVTPGSTTTSSVGNSSAQLPADDNGGVSDGNNGGSGNDNNDNGGGSGSGDSDGGSGSGGDDVFVDGDEDTGV